MRFTVACRITLQITATLEGLRVGQRATKIRPLLSVNRGGTYLGQSIPAVFSFINRFIVGLNCYGRWQLKEAKIQWAVDATLRTFVLN